MATTKTIRPGRRQALADLKNHYIARSLFGNQASKALSTLSDDDVDSAVAKFRPYDRMQRPTPHEMVKEETAKLELIQKAANNVTGERYSVTDIMQMHDEGKKIPVKTPPKQSTGRYTDPDFDFYGRYGNEDDATRERYVSQVSVTNGKTPAGRPAKQQGVDGYVGDERVRQQPVLQGGVTPDGRLANQPAVEGFLTKEPKAELKGLKKPEVAHVLFGGKKPTNPRPKAPIGSPRLPGQVKRRSKRR